MQCKVSKCIQPSLTTSLNDNLNCKSKMDHNSDLESRVLSNHHQNDNNSEPQLEVLTSSSASSRSAAGPVTIVVQHRDRSVLTLRPCPCACRSGLCKRHAYPALFLCLCLVILSVSGYAFLSSRQFSLRPNMSTTSDRVAVPEGRCFSMCEPPDLSKRDDKLMKPIVIHDNNFATRFFLYLFPNEPEFKKEEVGEAAYLTNYVLDGKMKEGRERARVRLDQWPQMESYAGFFNVNPRFGSHLYFWFFPSQQAPSSDPVILWLQGGPGATSLFGLFKENGPIKAYAVSDKKMGEFNAAKERNGGGNQTFNEETKCPHKRSADFFDRRKHLPFPMYDRYNPHAELNRYSWNRNASIIYIDNPVGTGFSYTEDNRGYPNYVNQSSEDVWVALQQFFQLFPDYADRDFYIFGESYAGKYVPALSHRIHLAKTDPDRFGGQVDINLAGIGIGNGWMSPLEQGKYASYLYYHGLLDGEQYLTLLELEDSLVDRIANGEWFSSWLASDQQLHFILKSLNYSSLYDLTKGQFNPGTMDFWYWVQQPHIRKAMNLGTRSMSDGLEIYKAMIEDTMQSIRPELVEAMENYKVLIYHGALDIICHFPGAQEMLAKTNWTGKEGFHKSERKAFWTYNEETTRNELAGYVKGDGRLKFALVLNAGHSVPMDQPQTTLRLVEAFLNDEL